MMLNDFHAIEKTVKRKDMFILKCVPAPSIDPPRIYPSHPTSPPRSYHRPPGPFDPFHTHINNYRYESLKERSKRMGTLRKLVSFLGTHTHIYVSVYVCMSVRTTQIHVHNRLRLYIDPPTHPPTIPQLPHPPLTGLAAPDPKRLGCADLLADRPDTHRTAMVAKEALAAELVTKEEVYTPEIACMMWLIFGKRARKLGYALPPWIKREECRTVRYDWSLVLPGQVVRRRKQELGGGTGGAQQQAAGGKKKDGGKEAVVAAEKK